MSEVKRMDIAEFVSEGYLQELNRVFLHPLGLALEVVTDEEGTPVALGGVWDYRDDPEGIFFTEGIIDPKKVGRVAQLVRARKAERQERLGYWVQPINEG